MKLSGSEGITIGFAVVGYESPEEPTDTWSEIELTITTPHGSGVGHVACAQVSGVQSLADWLEALGERRRPLYPFALVEEPHFQLSIRGRSAVAVRLEAYLILARPGEWAMLPPDTSDDTHSASVIGVLASSPAEAGLRGRQARSRGFSRQAPSGMNANDRAGDGMRCIGQAQSN